jgi:hypothetical protein
MKNIWIRKINGVLPICTLAAALSVGTVPGQNASLQAEEPVPRKVVVREQKIVTTNAPTKQVATHILINKPRGVGGSGAWLGVGTEEAPEALSSQLKLSPGVGLVVNYVGEDSPAAQAGIRKNDLLTHFEDHQLVHPEQLRKLVQVRKPGEQVTLKYLRGGEEQSVEVTLAKTTGRPLPLLGDTPLVAEEMENLQHSLRELPWRDAVRGQARVLREQLGNIKIDQERIREEVQRSLDEAKRAVEEALKHARDSKDALDPAAETLKELERSRSERSVIVTTDAKEVRSLVRADDSGTIVLVSDPKVRLTAHDKKGTLIFDGPIQTAQERAKVPRELWDRVEPLLEEFRTEAADKD